MWEVVWLCIKTVIVVLVIFILFSLIRVLKPGDHIMTELQPLNTMRTGDILAVAYPHVHGHLVKIFNGSMWTHVGLIVVDNDGKTWVWEMCNYSETVNKKTATTYPKRKHIEKLSLEEWLYRNRRQIICQVPYTGPKLDAGKVHKLYESLRERVKQDMFVVNWLQVLVKWPYKKDEPAKRMYCTQLAAYVLQQMDVISKTYDPASYSPKDFVFRKGPYTKDGMYGEARIVHIPQ